MHGFVTHTEDSAPAASVPRLVEMRERFGTALNLFGNMAESPALLDAYVELSNIFGRSALDERQQAVVLLTVSRFHDCRYCVAAHSVGADAAGVSAEITEAIRTDQPIPQDELEALRQFTHKLLENRGWVSQDALTAFLEAGYSREQLLDVIVGVALKTLSNYTNHITGTEVDQVLRHRAWVPPSK